MPLIGPLLELFPATAPVAEAVDTALAVPKAPGLGPDPSGSGFGAIRLDTGDIRGHGDYLDPGTVALAQIAAVAAGRADELRDVTADGPMESFREQLRDTVDGGQALERLHHDLEDRVLDVAQTALPDVVDPLIDTYQSLNDAWFEFRHERIDDAQAALDAGLELVGDVGNGVARATDAALDGAVGLGKGVYDTGADLVDEAGDVLDPRHWHVPRLG
jgi:hypothetical protein